MRHSFTKTLQSVTDAINNYVQMIFIAEVQMLYLDPSAQAFENRLNLVCQFTIICLTKVYHTIN